MRGYNICDKKKFLSFIPLSLSLSPWVFNGGVDLEFQSSYPSLVVGFQWQSLVLSFSWFWVSGCLVAVASVCSFGWF